MTFCLDSSVLQCLAPDRARRSVACHRRATGQPTAVTPLVSITHHCPDCRPLPLSTGLQPPLPILPAPVATAQHSRSVEAVCPRRQPLHDCLDTQLGLSQPSHKSHCCISRRYHSTNRLTGVCSCLRATSPSSGTTRSASHVVVSAWLLCCGLDQPGQSCQPNTQVSFVALRHATSGPALESFLHVPAAARSPQPAARSPVTVFSLPNEPEASPALCNSTLFFPTRYHAGAATHKNPRHHGLPSSRTSSRLSSPRLASHRVA